MLVATLGSLALGSRRVEAESLTAITSTSNLVMFDSSTPGTILSSVAISGLQSGETLLGIDRRQANGLLYGLGNTSRIYTVDITTVLATAVNGSANQPGLDRDRVRLRLQSGPRPDPRSQHRYDQLPSQPEHRDARRDGHAPNLRSGRLGRGPDAAGRRVGLRNNFSGTAVATLFGIDSNRDALVMQDGSPRVTGSRPIACNWGTVSRVPS